MSKSIKRIQRKRKKGWKMPFNTVSVCRPHKWGNPLKIERDMIYVDAGYRRKHLEDRWVFVCIGTLDLMLSIYRAMWERDYDFLDKATRGNTVDILYWIGEFLKLDLDDLKGKDLACFCSLDSPCHADVLISLSNGNG